MMRSIFRVSHIKIISFILLFFCNFAEAQNTPDIQSGQKLKSYTSIEFVRQAGDYYGLEITFVPASYGMYVLFRSASGRINTPYLVEALPDEKKWKFVVPEGDDESGKWSAEIRGQALIAVAPKGTRYQLRLAK